MNGNLVLDTKLIKVFTMWEETSYQLELRQANTACVKQEWDGNYKTIIKLNILKYSIINSFDKIVFVGLEKRKGVTYKVTFDPSAAIIKNKSVRVAVLREEGNIILQYKLLVLLFLI